MSIEIKSTPSNWGGSWEDNVEGVTDRDRWDGLKVTRGAFVLNNACLIVNHRGVKVWTVDCRSKYPDAWVLYGGSDDEGHYKAEIHVWPQSESPDDDIRILRGLRMDETYRRDDGAPQMTGIDIPGRWEQVIVAGGRYELTIVALRPKRSTP